MAKPARRRCKNDECREWFHPAFANQWWCSPECGTKIALERRSREREKAEKAAEKKRRREEQKQKDKLKIRKLALKPRSYWIKQAQQAVNAFIRERDRDLPCISCGTLTSAQWDAGHYRTTAAHLNSDLMNAIFTSNAWCAISIKAEISFRIASN